MAVVKVQMKPQETSGEILREDGNVSLPDLSALMTNLAAFHADNASLNDIELFSVTAAIAYVAYTQNANEDTVCSILTSAFGTNGVKTLPSRLYNEIILFLVDLRVNEVVN